jgi:hypothetical protein
MTSSVMQYWWREDLSSEPSVIARKMRSIDEFPDEIMLKIFSYVGPEDLCLIIAKACERWKALAKDVVLWKTLSYHCGRTSDISRVDQMYAFERISSLLVLCCN